MIPLDMIEQAACIGLEPELFFPTRNTNQHDTELKQVKAICAGCPVRVECLQEALSMNESGVWGGTTNAERDRLRGGGRHARMAYESGPTRQKGAA